MRRRPEPGPRFLDNAFAIEDAPPAGPELVNGRTMTTIGRLPLAFGPVEITLMEQVAQALLETRLRSAAREGVQIGRAQIAIARQRAEDLEVAASQLDAFAGMMGSLVFAGGMDLSKALAARDPDGIELGSELERIGYSGPAPLGRPRPSVFVELHIEQGPILDLKGERLGAVGNLQGIFWQRITIRGTSNHAGTTPMDLRHDAGYCAARIATFVREIASDIGPPQVATVGSIRLAPNLINVIAREAVVTVDLRNTDLEKLQEAERRLNAMLAMLKAQEGVEIDCEILARFDPVVFDPNIVAAIEDVAAALQQPIRRMTSGAGHDAQMMARICPAAMIFVPSVGGISHNPLEFTKSEDLENGANVLLRTMLELAR